MSESLNFLSPMDRIDEVINTLEVIKNNYEDNTNENTSLGIANMLLEEYKKLLEIN